MVSTYGNTSCSNAMNNKHKNTVRPEMWGSCRQKPGRAEKEAQGRRQTEGIIVHTHSCGLPCSINTSQTHDSIVRAEQSLHWSTKFTLLLESLSAGCTWYTHRYTFIWFWSLDSREPYLTLKGVCVCRRFHQNSHKLKPLLFDATPHFDVVVGLKQWHHALSTRKKNP